MNNYVGIKKKGLSPVIAVVLLLVITMIAAGIIIGVVVPFVQDNLEDSKACFEVLNDLSFASTLFNCVNDTSNRTGFSVRIDSEEITGFRVSLQAQGSSDSFDVEAGFSLDKIKMLKEDSFNTSLQVPERGGVRTYVANGTFDRVEIFPILSSGAKCDLADDITLSICTDSNAITIIGK